VDSEFFGKLLVHCSWNHNWNWNRVWIWNKTSVGNGKGILLELEEKS